LNSPSKESTEKSFQNFQSAVDKKDRQTTSEYKGKPLKTYLEFLIQLSPYLNTGKDITPYITDMVNILLESKRYLDLASIFIFLKNHNESGNETGKMYPLVKEILKPDINRLFKRSITYKSLELNEMFSDILGEDHALLMELVSFIFKEYGLFNAKLSENIYREFIEVADKDIKKFIEHSDSKFLAFYLSNIPHLPFVPAEHISKWTELILNDRTGEEYTSKIISAMKDHPSLDILMIFILFPRENLRSEAISLLKDCLDMGLVNEKVFAKSAPYFLEKSLKSQFYDFYNIPRSQKEIFSDLILATGGKELKHIIISMIREKNLHNDPKITETKMVFTHLLKKLISKDPEMTIIIRQMIKDETVEPVIKEALLKITA